MFAVLGKKKGMRKMWFKKKKDHLEARKKDKNGGRKDMTGNLRKGMKKEMRKLKWN